MFTRFSSNNKFKLYSDVSLSVSLIISNSSVFVSPVVSSDFSEFEFSSKLSSSPVFILSRSSKVLSTSYSIPVSNNSSCSVSVCSVFVCSEDSGVLLSSSSELFSGVLCCILSKFSSACSILNSKLLLHTNISIMCIAISAIVNPGFSEYFMLPIKFINFVSLVLFFVPISSPSKSLNIRNVYSLYVAAGTFVSYQFQNLSNFSLIPSGG